MPNKMDNLKWYPYDKDPSRYILSVDALGGPKELGEIRLMRYSSGRTEYLYYTTAIYNYTGRELRQIAQKISIMNKELELNGK